MGSFPEGCEVEGFVKFALVDGAVAEEAYGNAVFVLVLAGERESGGDRHLSANDGVSAHKVLFQVEQVHGAALAAAAAGRLAAEFGHGDFGGHALCEGVSVVAVVADDVVVGAQGGYCADGDGFFADVQMQEAADFALHVETSARFLKASN